MAIATEYSVQQGSEEWFGLRCGIPTVSNLSKVLSKGKKKGAPSLTRATYLMKKTMEVLTGEVEEDYSSEDMKNGNKYEQYARKFFEKETGIKMREAGIFIHNTMRVGASPDGINDEEKIGLEIKILKKKNHYEALKADRPKKMYRDQITGQIWLCDLQGVYLLFFQPLLFLKKNTRHLSWRLMYIPRDEEGIDLAEDGIEAFLDDLDEETNFWSNYKSEGLVHQNA